MRHRGDANWKMLPENDSGGYHLGFAHRAMFMTLRSQYQRVVDLSEAGRAGHAGPRGGSRPMAASTTGSGG